MQIAGEVLGLSRRTRGGRFWKWNSSWRFVDLTACFDVRAFFPWCLCMLSSTDLAMHANQLVFRVCIRIHVLAPLPRLLCDGRWIRTGRCGGWLQPVRGAGGFSMASRMREEPVELPLFYAYESPVRISDQRVRYRYFTHCYHTRIFPLVKKFRRNRRGAEKLGD